MATIKKRAPGRWKKGESGNPKGRRPGSGEVGKIRASISARVPEILARLIEQALAGDTGAARLLLERAIAPLKAAEQTERLTLPVGTLTQQGRAVLASVARGELAPTQGAALLGAIGTLARVTEMDELTSRIKALEDARNGNA